MTSAYVTKLVLKVQTTNVGAQKIYGSIFQTFEMALASFWVNDKLEKSWFFQKIFLIVNTSIQMILRIFFLIFSKTDLLFAEKELI